MRTSRYSARETFRAWAAQDAAAYGNTMADEPVLIAASGGVYQGKQAKLTDMANDPCDVRSYDFADTKVRMLSMDVAVLTYRLTQDASCKSIGKLPSKAFVTSIYVRHGNEWRWVSYQETPIRK